MLRFLEENADLGLGPAIVVDAATMRFLEENTWLAADADVARAAGDPARPCHCADAAGVPGEGCGPAWSPAADPPAGMALCPYAGARGVPGEGCRPGVDVAQAR